MSERPPFTDRDVLTLHRSRAARQPSLFLHEEAAIEVQERLADINKVFRQPLLIGHITPPIREILPAAAVLPDTPTLNVNPSTHDLVVHSFGLHWADDPIGQMVQSRLALQRDGLFLGVMFGGATLQELRAVLAESETHLLGGLSPRVLPMADLRDLGGLLQRAGFSLPVADSRMITVRYPSLAALITDLRGMGETNAMVSRNKVNVPRGFFKNAQDLYQTHYSDDGYLVATFELVFLTGWAPDPSQQQPLRPGSAKSRLADALGVPEAPLKRD